MSTPLLAWAKNILTSFKAAAKNLPGLQDSVRCATPAAVCTARGSRVQQKSSSTLLQASLFRRSFCSQTAATGQPAVKRKLGIPFALTAVAAGAGAVYVVATAGLFNTVSVTSNRHFARLHIWAPIVWSAAVQALVAHQHDTLVSQAAVAYTMCSSTAAHMSTAVRLHPPCIVCSGLASTA